MRTAILSTSLALCLAPVVWAQPTVEIVIEMLRNTRPLTVEVLAEAEKQFAALNAPESDRTKYAQALIDRAKGDAKKAKATLEILTKEHPKVAEYQATYGTLCFDVINDAGMFEKMSIASSGRAAYEAAIKLDPSMVEPRIGLARFFLNAPGYAGGSTRKAEEQANAIIGLPDGKGEMSGRTLLADIYASQGEWDKMTEQYQLAEKAPGAETNATTARRANALALLNKKKDPKAALVVIERYQRLAAPDDASPYFLTGEAQRALGNDSEAIIAYSRAVELSPVAMNSRFALAELLEKNKRYGEASTQYGEFAKRFPEDPRAAGAIKSAAKCAQKAK